MKTKKQNLSSSAQTFILLMFFILFYLTCIYYFIAFSYDFKSYNGDSGLFQLALNSHDHQFYLDTVDFINDYGIGYGLNNDIGIASIYIILTNIFNFLINDDLTLISFIFNSIILIATFYIWCRICNELKLSLSSKLTFFLGIYFIYFVQLINKDMLTVFLLLLSILLGIQKRFFLLILIIPFFFLVRQQLAVFSILFISFMQVQKPKKRIVVAYVITSVAAGILSVVASIISEESLGGGFSIFLVEFNQKYYVGYLLFNPIRVFQYVLDAYLSFFCLSENGGIDTAKLLRIPQLILLTFLIKQIFELVRNFNYWLDTPAKPLILTIIAFLIAWLMNPTVNARYVMLITPVILLAALYIKKYEKHIK